MIGLLLWKLPEKRGRSLRVGERSILHMRFTCAEITRGPKTPEAVLRRRVSAAGKRLRKLGITRAVVALQTSCENFSNNLQKRNGA